MVEQYFRLDESTMEEVRAGKRSLRAVLEAIERAEVLEWNKDLPGLEFFLSGDAGDTTADPSSKVVLSWNQVDTEDDEVFWAYYASYMASTEVRKASQALAQVSEEWFRTKFLTADLVPNGISDGDYSGSWSESGRPELRVVRRVAGVGSAGGASFVCGRSCWL